jgi:GAF domain-containing protein
LAIVWDQSPQAVFQNLLAAVQAGLIQPRSELDENLLVQKYKFLHDRVQQAAYTLIDESQKQGVHLQIGRNLLEKTSPEQRAERLFEIVDHLNYGIGLIPDQSEQNEIAELNLQAGQKALAATAYEAAFKYFNTGLELLDVGSWQREYDLTLALHSEAAEAAYLNGHFAEMERLVEAVLIHAKTVLDTVKVYDSRTQTWLSRGEPEEALKAGLEVLQLLGISLVEAPSQLDIQAGLEETAAKAKNLETHYPSFFPQSNTIDSIPIRTTAGTTSNNSSTAIDLAAVMKASQAISSEIELEQLLRSLMQILIENAGAQTGYLLLENAGEWTIEAACELVDGEQVCTTKVLQSLPIADRLPESVVQYIVRTHEPIILKDATRRGNFINDPYIQQNQAQSVLCLPLLNQSKLVGVLYLENQLATGVFTPERSQLLNLLSTQAAIAIENAKLDSKLRARESQMAQFLEAIPVGIGIVDAVGRPYYSNQRGIQLMGKAIDPSVPPDQLAEAYQFYVTGTNQIYPTERLPAIRALNGEYTTIDDMDIRQNNTTIPIEVWGTPVFDEQGKVVYGIVAFQDITERRQAEQLLADYNRTLEQQVAQRTADLEQN